MKRKQSDVPKQLTFNCDDMEELNVGALSRRKESAAPLTEDKEAGQYLLSYPLALVLRLRVLQIVCGTSAMVMGSVAFIEERQKFNLSLGIPAGGISVLAAAVSIHTSVMGAKSRAAAGAGAAIVLWCVATCLLLALVAQCARTIAEPTRIVNGSVQKEEESQPSSRDLIVIACIQITLSVATLLSAAVCARIDCSS